MDAEELRALQTPLKERYRAEPAAALVTLRARGRLGEAGVSCRVETGRALVEAGLHPALEALVACAGVTLQAVATALALPLAGGTVSAEGDLDFRGTLGVAKDVPVGFQAIRLRFDLDTAATQEQIATLLRLTERYCVVYQTLKQPASVTVTLSARDPRG